MDENLYNQLLAEAAYNHQAQAIEIIQLKEKLRLQDQELVNLRAVLLKAEIRLSLTKTVERPRVQLTNKTETTKTANEYTAAN